MMNFMEHERQCFTPGRILVASLLGGLPAGLFLYRHNAYLFGKEKEGNQVFFPGIGLTLIGVGISVLGNGPLTNSLARAFGLVSVILPFFVARRIQANDLKRYQEAGGQTASYAKAVTVGFVSLVAILAVGFLTAWLAGS
jgi:hypothetical protein